MGWCWSGVRHYVELRLSRKPTASMTYWLAKPYNSYQRLDMIPNQETPGHKSRVNLIVKVLDFVQCGGPKWKVGSTMVSG